MRARGVEPRKSGPRQFRKTPDRARSQTAVANLGCVTVDGRANDASDNTSGSRASAAAGGLPNLSLLDRERGEEKEVARSSSSSNISVVVSVSAVAGRGGCGRGLVETGAWRELAGEDASVLLSESRSSPAHRLARWCLL